MLLFSTGLDVNLAAAQAQPVADTSYNTAQERLGPGTPAGLALPPPAEPAARQHQTAPSPALAQYQVRPQSQQAEHDAARECLVTNVFYDSDVREILQAMAAQCFLTVIADETVSGIITVELEEVPFEDAMRRILTPFGLTYRWVDGYYLVGSPRPDNPSFPLLTTTELYRPNFIKVTALKELLSSFYEPFLKVDPKTNIISLTGSPELIARIRADLAAIDVPPRQVMIEALVTETSSDVNRQLGISWNLGATGGSRGTDSIGIDAYPTRLGDSAYVPGVDRFSALLQRIDVKSGDWLGQFRVKLDAFVEEGEARIRANPRIATLEGQQASIFIGREEYFSILTGSVSFAYAQLEVIKTGIILTITPYVSEDGYITLEVEPQVSDVVGAGSTGLPVTNKRSVKTTVRVTNGETAVIGGLLVKNRIEVVRKVPLLGSIPILGHLFRHTELQTLESEISVLITPRMWSDMTSDPGHIHEPLMR